MTSSIKEKTLPLRVDREITFILYNYNNIEELIERRKEDLIDKIKISNSAYLKSLKNEVDTLENIVIKFDTDKNIRRLKKWKEIINSYKSKLYDEEIPTYYLYIQFKYFERFDDSIVMERLNLTREELKELDIDIKMNLYSLAQKEKLYKREVL